MQCNDALSMGSCFRAFLKKNPQTDAGLHLTLTSEWSEYRWPSLSGKSAAPGLTDTEGAMWPSVEDVIKHASADEVEKEIRAQIDRARSMGFEPTHFDTHMGTLLATPAFTERYIKLGIEMQIPVMIPAGHSFLIQKQMNLPEAQLQQMQEIGKTLWNAGLPVLDDLHTKAMSGKSLEALGRTIKNYRLLKPGNI